VPKRSPVTPVVTEEVEAVKTEPVEAEVEEVVVKAKVAPIEYDPYSDTKPACFSNWKDNNSICRKCKYHKECKK